MVRTEKTIAKSKVTGKSRPLEPVMLALLICIVLFFNFLWLHQGEWAFPNTDAYDYLGNLLYFLNLSEAGLAPEFPASLKLLSHGGRPPLYQILSAPPMLLFGRTEEAALAINFVLVTILMIATYHMGRLAKDRKTGLLSAFLLVCYPPVLHLTRVYVPHFAALVCGALSLWCLLILIAERRSIVVALLLGLALAFGLLFHPSFLWTAVGPTVFGGLYLLLFQTKPTLPQGFKELPAWLFGKLRDRFVLLGLLPAAIAAVALPSVWYLTFGSRMLGIISTLKAVGMEEFRGASLVARGFPEVDPSFAWYLQTAPGALSVFSTGLILLGLVSVFFLRRMSLWILAIALVSGYVLISVQTSFWWMYGAPILPAAAVLAATFAMSVHPRWLRRSFVLICLAMGGFTFVVATWGVAENWTGSVARALGAPLDSSTCQDAGTFALCPGVASAQSAGWPLNEIFETVLDDPLCQGDQHCTLMYLFLRHDMPIGRFRYNLLRDWPLANLKTTTLHGGSWGHRFDLEPFLSSDYIVYPAEPVRRGGRADYRGAAADLLQDPPPEFVRNHSVVASFSYPGGTAQLLKRRGLVSGVEAEAVVRSLDLPDLNKAGSEPYIARLYLEEGDIEKASTLYASATDKRWAARYRMEIVKAYESAGNLEAALSELKLIVALDPENPSLLGRLARMYNSRGDVEQAIRLYKEGLDRTPEYIPARVDLASLYWRRGDSKAAFFELREARRYAPEDSWPVRVLARFHQVSGNKAQAIELYREALKLSPDDEKSRKQLAKLLR